jgi:CheY-like chemotaxis protein
MSSTPSRDPPLVLLLEEETTERAVMVEHLTAGGYRVVEASDSEEALSALSLHSDVQAIVTDAHVPGKIDGYEFAQLVRERWPQVATIMTSGHSDGSSGPIPQGGEFIAKPYLLEHLLPTLQRMLRRTG